MKTLIPALAFLLCVVIPCQANPIPVPLPASMPLEDMHVQILPHGDGLRATFTGDFTFTYIPEEVTSMLFPVPPDACHIRVWQDEVELSWSWSAEEYPTILPEMPTMPMIQWQGPFPLSGAVFRVDYEHSLIERPDEFIFFYANGTGKYFPTYEKTTTAYFDITLPVGYVVKGVWWDELPYAYQVDGYHLTMTVQSYFGPIVHDVIVSLVSDPAGDDCNGNGIPDGEDLAPPVDLSNRTDYAVGNNPSAVDFGDFNGDSAPDMVVTNRGDDSISVKFNIGNGAFLGPSSSYAVGNFPRAVTTGDFDKDNDVDIAVANSHSDNVSVLLNNGNGTFAPKTDYAAGNGPCCIQTADLDGDTDNDLVVANEYGKNISILLNNGDGTFALPVNYPVGDYTNWVACGDFNGDGKPDLAAACGGSVSAAILMNNGNGTFAPPVSYDVLYATSVACGDFDSDSNIDVAVVSPDPKTITILKNNGAGVFTIGPTYGVRPQPENIIAADLDDDGHLDLAVAGSDYYDADMEPVAGAVSLLINRGDGTFRPGPDVRMLGVYLRKAAVANLNNDSLPELAVANGYDTSQVTVFLNQTPPPLSHDWNGNDMPDECESLKAADFDFDGDYDINDVWVLANHWLLTECRKPDWCDGTDVDENHCVNLGDFAVFAQHWPDTYPPEPGMTYEIEDCDLGAAALFSTEQSESTRFTVIVEGQYIHFEDMMVANCCPEELGLEMTVEDNLITVHETEYTPGGCWCICDYPITATLGPFGPGTYTLEVYEDLGGFIGSTIVTIGSSP